MYQNYRIQPKQYLEQMCCLKVDISGGRNELSIQLKKPDNNNKIKPKQVEERNLAGFNVIENKKIKMWDKKSFKIKRLRKNRQTSEIFPNIKGEKP